MSYWSLLRAAAATAKISLPTVLDAYSHRERAEVFDARLSSWAREIVSEARITIIVEGEMPKRGSFLVVSNHESLYDIPVLFSCFPFPLRMAAKQELFSVPIWGRAMSVAGFVAIDRKRGKLSRERLFEEAEKLRRAGRSLWMAPEGTRGDGHGLLPFKTGAFDLARQLGLPLLPLTLRGTGRVLGKHARSVVRGQTVAVVVHPVILPEEFPKDRQTLIDWVHDLIESGLEVRSE